MSNLDEAESSFAAKDMQERTHAELQALISEHNIIAFIKVRSQRRKIAAATTARKGEKVVDILSTHELLCSSLPNAMLFSILMSIPYILHVQLVRRVHTAVALQ